MSAARRARPRLRLPLAPRAARRGGPWLVLLVAGAAFALWTQGVRAAGWSPDEEFFVQLARVLGEHFPGGLVDVAAVPDFNDRGIQRLLPVVLLVPLDVIGGETGFRLARALVALAFASTAVPVYLLARGIRLSVPWALVAGVLVVAVPWAVLATSFLTEPVAYPLVAWVAWAAWRACLVPGWRSDALAIAVVAVAALARTGNLVLVALPALAVALHAVAAGGGPRVVARRLLREHPLLSPLLLGGALVALLGLVGARPLVGVFGSYTTAIGALDWSPVPAKFARESSRIVVGVGVLPVLVGLPWAVLHALRGRERETRALAIVCLLGTGLLLLATLYSAEEERYLMAVAPLLVLPGIAALARRDVPGAAIVATGALLALLVWRVPWTEATDAAEFQVDAARTFFTRIVLGGLSAPLPGPPQAAVALAVLAAGAALAALRRRPVVLAVAVTALVGLQLTQAAYVTTKRADRTAPPVPLSDRTWIDDTVGDETVGIFAEGQANELGFEGTWREAEFFNERIQVRAATADGPASLMPRYATYRALALDERTGALTPRDRGPALPRLWLQPTLFSPIVLSDTQPIGESRYLAMRLVRVDRLRALVRWAGVEPDGWLTAENPVGRLDVFPAARAVAPRACLQLLVVAPANYTGVHRYAISGGGVRAAGALRAAERRTVRVPLARGMRRLTFRTQGTVEALGDRRLALQVAASDVVRC